MGADSLLSRGATLSPCSAHFCAVSRLKMEVKSKQNAAINSKFGSSTHFFAPRLVSKSLRPADSTGGVWFGCSKNIRKQQRKKTCAASASLGLSKRLTYFAVELQVALWESVACNQPRAVRLSDAVVFCLLGSSKDQRRRIRLLHSDAVKLNQETQV